MRKIAHEKQMGRGKKLMRRRKIRTQKEEEELKIKKEKYKENARMESTAQKKVVSIKTLRMNDKKEEIEI